MHATFRKSNTLQTSTRQPVTPQTRNKQATPSPAAKAFIEFVNASPSPFHAVAEVRKRLEKAGFVLISERDAFKVKRGGKYFFTRNQSSIVAFAVGGAYAKGNGISIVGAHTDSPCLKVKPKSKKETAGYAKVGVETYGGGLWHTWFDRDLSIAGRVVLRSGDGGLQHKLVRIERPILRIPTLAIHLDRNVNSEGFKFNTETQLTPMLASAAKILNGEKKDDEKHHSAFLKSLADEMQVQADTIGDFELCLYDTQPSTIGGLENEFIFSPRIDNLMSSFTAITALINSVSTAAVDTLKTDTTIRLVTLFDNEEVGSESAYGAGSNLLPATLKRLAEAEVEDALVSDASSIFVPSSPTSITSSMRSWEFVDMNTNTSSQSAFERAMQKSFLISADMAHAIHPNYSEKHEENHRPAMNKGVVIKQNANQRYATTSVTTAILREVARKRNVPLQEFVVRNDSPCGSTIGPMLSANLGIRTIDVGSPQLSMHSIRETCGVEDVQYAIDLFQSFFEDFASIDAKVKVDEISNLFTIMNLMNPWCPAPFIEGSIISPCLLDNVSAVILFIASIACLVMARNRLKRGAPTSAETRSLLGRAGEPIDEDDVASRRSTPALSFTVGATLSIIATLIAMLIIDFILLLIPGTSEGITLPHFLQMPARTLADTINLFSWLLILSSILINRPSSFHIGIRFWSVSLLLDIVEVYQWMAVLMREEDGRVVVKSEKKVEWGWILPLIWGGAFAIRLVLTASLLTVSWMTKQDVHHHHHGQQDEEQPATTESEGAKAKKKQQQSSWALTLKNFGKLMPFLWPKGVYLQVLMGCSFLMLLVGRVVNVAVPLQYKVVVDVLTDETKGEGKGAYYVWAAVLTFCFFRYLQGGVGVVSTLQSLFWIPVGQYNAREISVKMLQHLHNLSLQFHINRKTGEVLRVMDRGTSSVSSLLQSIVFNIFPIFVDIGVAVVWFILQFDLTAGIIVFTTMALYIVLTVIITEWRTKFRREMNELDSLARARAVDSLLNFETVKYYNNESYEVSRFEQSIQNYQKADWKSNASLALLNSAQNTVITLGLVAGSMLIARRVIDGKLSVGDFILFITYIIQLYQPLNWFGTYYRAIQQNFIDMESMFELFAEQADVQDVANAAEMRIVRGGSVKFDNVSFSYDARLPAIKNLSFEVPAQTTTALVGVTGSGKSTIFRLLFRFYNPTAGRILIDGQDISKVTQKSLRKAIGVVPQDTVLFNESIAYNIAYGDTNKDEEEVIEAAKMAQIHDKIMSFPDGYETRVGERGLRLSGGEKQRVAIARTMLKNPDIILLDEATSALDNNTESLIQRSLKELTSRKTTLVIAHRLSTVIDADCILVLKEGRIVERGTHEELLKRGEERARVKALGGTKEAVVPASSVTGLKGDPDAILPDHEDDGVGTYYAMWMRQMEETKTKEEEEKAKAGQKVTDEKALMEVRRARGAGAGTGGGDYHSRGHGGGRFH
ncbi:ATP-binding cassette sub- B member 6, mitochondrial [Phlyctochytrium planicorne]|nr:ATP-binding cassette sub- B member 6, mitochondrial [Phlyctochytrium planicorne]